VGCKGGAEIASRFGQSGAAREMNLVQIVVEASAIRGGLPNTRRAINHVVLRRWHVLDAHENIARRSDAQPLFRDR